MHEFWTTPAINMMYTRLQNYTNMVVGKYVIQTFKIVVNILLFCCCHLIFLSPQVRIPPPLFGTSGLSKYTCNTSFNFEDRFFKQGGVDLF